MLGLNEMIKYIGGFTKTVLCDNLKTVVTKSDNVNIQISAPGYRDTCVARRTQCTGCKITDCYCSALRVAVYIVKLFMSRRYKFTTMIRCNGEAKRSVIA